MNITPLDFGAWISICCGFILLRAMVVPCRREGQRSGLGRKRFVTGALLIFLGVAVLVAVLVHHLVRGH